MSKKYFSKKFISSFLALLMLFSSIFSWGDLFKTFTYADTKNMHDVDSFVISQNINDANKKIQVMNRWKKEGLIVGDEKGNLQPHKEITRAELMAIVNKTFGYTKKSELVENYKDVKKGDWYYDIVAVALEAGYVKGVSKDKMEPNRIITNQEAMVILASLTGGYDKSNLEGLENAKDKNYIPEWSKPAIAKCIRDGYTSGDNGYINATLDMTRADAIFMLDHKLTDTRTYGLAGTYDLKGKAVKNIQVDAQDVNIKNAVVLNDITVNKSVGEGNVSFDNIKVKGNVNVYGGGENSIIFNSVNVYGSLIIKKDNGKVRIVARGNTKTKTTVLKSGAILVEQANKSGVFEKVEIPADIVKGQKIQLVGNFDTVNSSAKDINIEVDGSVKILELKEDANVSGNGKISNLRLNNGAEVIGDNSDLEIVRTTNTKTSTSTSTNTGFSGSSSISSSDSDSSKSKKSKNKIVYLQALNFKESAYELMSGQSLAGEVEFTPQNACESQKGLIWSVVQPENTPDNNKVTVDNNGVITGNVASTARIVIKSESNANISAQADVVIRKEVKELKIINQPSKKIYKIGEQLDLAGLKVVIVNKDLTRDDLDLSRVKITGFDSSVAAKNKEIVLSKYGKSVSFNVDVVEPTPQGSLLRDIKPLSDINFENGISAQNIKASLPTSVEISYVTSGTAIDVQDPSKIKRGRLNVQWLDIPSSYVQNNKYAQNFNVTGSAILVNNMTNPQNISTQVVQTVKVLSKKFLVSIIDSTNGNVMNAQRVEVSKKAVMPTMVPKEGHTFRGYKVANDPAAADFDFANTAILKDENIYAVYEINQYNVLFDLKNPTTNIAINVPNQTVDYNKKVVKPSSVNSSLIKAGYDLYWYTDEARTVLYNFETPVKNDLTLYGKYIQVDQLEQAAQALTFDVIKKSNSEESNIKGDLNLITDMTQYPAVGIVWTSSNTDVVLTNGTVVRPSADASDVNVTLSATLSETGKADVTKTFNVIVKQMDENYVDPRFAQGYPKLQLVNEGQDDERFELHIKLKDGVATVSNPLEVFVVADMYRDDVILIDPNDVVLGIEEAGDDYAAPQYYVKIEDDNVNKIVVTEQTIRNVNDFMFVIRDGQNLSQAVTDLTFTVQNANELDEQGPELYNCSNGEQDEYAFVNDNRDKIFIYYDEVLDKTSVPEPSDFTLTPDGTVTNVNIGDYDEGGASYVELSVSGYNSVAEHQLAYTVGKNPIRDMITPTPNNAEDFNVTVNINEVRYGEVTLSHLKNKIFLILYGSGWAYPSVDEMWDDIQIDLVSGTNNLLNKDMNLEAWNENSKQYIIELGQNLENTDFTIMAKDIPNELAIDGDSVTLPEFVSDNTNTRVAEELEFSNNARYSSNNKQIVIVPQKGIVSDSFISGVYFEIIIDGNHYKLSAGDAHAHYDNGASVVTIEQDSESTGNSYFEGFILPKLDEAFASGKTVQLLYKPSLFTNTVGDDSVIYDICSDELIPRTESLTFDVVKID